MSDTGARDWPLEPGERLLWTGKPDGGLHLRWKHLGLSIVGAIFLVLALAFSAQAWAAWRNDDDARLVLMASSVLFVGFGLWMLAGMHVVDMLRRRGQRYALTDRRAMIRTDFMGRGLASFPITAESPLWVAKTSPPSAYFAHVRRKVHPLDRLRRSMHQSATIDVGFELIEDAWEVYDMMCEIQKGQQ